MNVSPISTVLHEAISCLKGTCKDDSSIGVILDSINSMDFSAGNLSELTGYIPAHFDLLDTAISQIHDRQFAGLKAALVAAKNQLYWKIDDGGFYADGADVGEGYRTGNMHTLLIGPENAAVNSDNFLLGFFLLAPCTLYRDHKHLAPEVYIPLTGPTGWRFGLGDWEEHVAGSKIFNAPEVVHATRVYKTPFLALFAWSRDIAAICTVVNADDWKEVEENLRRNSRK